LLWLFVWTVIGIAKSFDNRGDRRFAWLNAGILVLPYLIFISIYLWAEYRDQTRKREYLDKLEAQLVPTRAYSIPVDSSRMILALCTVNDSVYVLTGRSADRRDTNIVNFHTRLSPRRVILEREERETIIAAVESGSVKVFVIANHVLRPSSLGRIIDTGAGISEYRAIYLRNNQDADIKIVGREQQNVFALESGSISYPALHGYDYFYAGNRSNSRPMYSDTARRLHLLFVRPAPPPGGLPVKEAAPYWYIAAFTPGRVKAYKFHIRSDMGPNGVAVAGNECYVSTWQGLYYFRL
jgi:hypothetical protein